MRILLLLAAAIGGFYVLRHFYRKYDLKPYQAVLFIGAIALIVLTLMGKAHWLVAVVGGTAALLGKLLFVGWRFFPLLRFAQQAYAGSKSHVTFRARWLEITVERATGVVAGVVLRGALRARTLESLDDTEIAAFGQSIADDPRSVALLQAYLQHARPNRAASGAAADFTDGPMSVEMAHKVLDVPHTATRDEIQAAYRQLAQKVHPDRGGSDYLARKINEARDVLLKDRD